MSTIAVIGGGAAGIGAARALLNEGMDVLLIEAAPRIGGNCRSDVVRTTHGWAHHVDVGVSDFNRTTFHELSSLVDELGLETRPIGTDASFASLDGRTVCAVRNGDWSFGPEVRDPDAFVRDARRFQERAVEVLEDGRFAGWTVERYLDHLGVSPELAEIYVYARAMGCFPMPDRHPKSYRIEDLIAFWRIHGVVGDAPANRHCVVGGMHRYTDAFRTWFESNGGELRCGTRVMGILRGKSGVEIRAVDSEDRHLSFDVSQVVLACTAHDALPLLELPTVEERDALARVPYQRARVVLHRDAELVGHRADLQGAFNYVVPAGDAPRVRPTITFFPNRLAGLPADAPDVYVTMNPHREPRPGTVVAERFFLHPVAGAENDRAVADLERRQGRRRTWYAGSHLERPFVHESALRTGIRVAERIARSERRRRVA